MENFFTKLRSIDVNKHTEKKGNLTYLSWAWAVDTLLQNDATATWEFPEPRILADGSVMVFCKVTAFGKTLPMQLPVMDNRNNAIKNPDARKISDATMRCLAKCIACFGVGLYIYAGEDLPEGEEKAPIKKAGQRKKSGEEIITAMNKATNLDELKDVWFSHNVEIAAFEKSNIPAERDFFNQIVIRKTELARQFEAMEAGNAN